MKLRRFGFCILCACTFLLIASDLLGEQAGSIVGWGCQVVVEETELQGLTAVSAGGMHGLGLKSDSTIVAWGNNCGGQCNVPSPNSGFVAIAAGSYHSLGLKAQVVSVPVTSPVAPRYVLLQNYPNPFNPVTVIRYELAAPSKIVLRVFDISGRLVKTLVNGPMEAGPHTVTWDGRSEADRNVASGIYFYRLEAGDLVATRTMVLLR